MATRDSHPNLTAAQLNVILAKTVANITLVELDQIRDAINRVPAPANRATATITSLLV